MANKSFSHQNYLLKIGDILFSDDGINVLSVESSDVCEIIPVSLDDVELIHRLKKTRLILAVNAFSPIFGNYGKMFSLYNTYIYRLLNVFNMAIELSEGILAFGSTPELDPTVKQRRSLFGKH